MPHAPLRHLPAALLAALLVSLAGCGGGSADTQAGAGCGLHSTAQQAAAAVRHRSSIRL
ncbi:hypothetical protein [Janthinobacterium lividum]|uniref:hypothetical protein n=1 Tax=Janthinobacterium lividum TaxID=29581 RepID=UPI000B2AD8BB|nr:hypothetical protein [Janthinobacterium lividum]